MGAEPFVRLEDIVDPLRVLGPEPDADSWTPQDLNDLPEHPPVEPQLGATSLVYPGKRHVFSGPPESAKTLAAYCILIQVVRLGGKGILVDFEMGGYDARQRLRELGATPIEISNIAYVEPDEPVTPERIAMLVALKPDLVVVDAAAGVYSLEGLDDNKRSDVEKISTLYIRVFWRSGIATILIDHVVKDVEQRGRFSIGSERKLGGADVHLGFEISKSISRGETGEYRIITHKDRGGYHKRGRLADMHLQSDPASHQIAWQFTDPDEMSKDQGYPRPTETMQEVSELLEQQDEPITCTTVVDALTRQKDTTLKAIKALGKENFVRQTFKGRAKLVESLRPYRDNDLCNPPKPVLRTLFSSMVPNGSGMVPEPPQSEWFHGSPPLREGTTGTTSATTPEPQGWFQDDGTLADAATDEWLRSVDPGPDDIEF